MMSDPKRESDKQGAQKSTRRIVILLLVILILGAISLRIITEGYRHVDANSTLRWAGEEWERGHALKSAEYFLDGMWMTLEGGTRWQIAAPWIEHTESLAAQNKLSEALESCYTALEILRGYDDEGVWSNECTVIDDCMQNHRECDLKERYRWIK